MKGKKVLKVFLVAMVVVTLLAQVSAFAEVTYTTDAEYDLATGKVKVTSTASGVPSGENVTFLVEDSEDEILYIDQENDVTSGSATFTYLVPTTAVNANAKVRFATTNTPATQIEGVTADDETIVDGCTVSYSVDGKGSVAAVVGLAAGDDVADGAEKSVADENASLEDKALKNKKVTFYIAPEAGYELTGYTKDSVAGDLALIVNGQVTFDVTADMEVEFTFGAITYKTEDVTAASITSSTITEEDGCVSAFATFAGDNVVEYGILLSNDDTVLNTLTAEQLAEYNYTEGPVRKCAAFGSINNKYAVKVEDGEEGYLTGPIKAIAYAIYKDAGESSVTVYGNESQLTFGE